MAAVEDAPASLPQVVKRLTDPQPSVRADACLRLATLEADEQAFTKVLGMITGDESIEVQRAATQAVGLLAKDKEYANQATDALEKLVGKSDLDMQMKALAVAGLDDLGGASAQQLGALLKDKSVGVRKAALVALAEKGEEAAPYAAEVGALLKSPVFRCEALAVLGHCGESASEFLPEILGYLDESSADIRFAAVEALGCLAKFVTSDMVSVVAELLTDENFRFRASAAAAIGRIGAEKAGDHMDELVKMLRDQTKPDRNLTQVPMGFFVPACMAAVALGRFGEKGAAMMNPLRELAEGRGNTLPCVRGHACEALGEMHLKGVKLDPSCVDALKNAKGDWDFYVNTRATKALETIGA